MICMRGMFAKLGRFEYLLVFLLLFHTVANFLWINLNTAPLPWDQAGHTLISYDFADFLKGDSSKSFLFISNYYPPLIHIIAGIGEILFGYREIIGELVVTVFFIFSILLVYLYAGKLFKDKTTAFLAAFIYSFVPTIYGLSRWFLLEIPLITFVLASHYFFLKSRDLSKTKYVIPLIIFSAAGFLTKWTMIIFLFTPFIFLLLKRVNLKLLGIYIFSTFILTSFWYIPNLKNISDLAQFTAKGAPFSPQNLISIDNFFFYLRLLVNFGLTWFLVLFLISGIIFIVRKRSQYTAFLLANIGVTYLAFTFISNKDLRYITPISPIFSILIGFFLASVYKARRRLGLSLIVILSFYLIFYFLNLSFGFPFDPKRVDYQRAINIPLVGWLDYINLSKETSQYLAPTFDRTKWPQEEFLDDTLRVASGNKINVLLVVDKKNLNLSNLGITQRKKGISNINLSSPYTTYYFNNIEELKKYVAYFHLALVADESFGPKDAMRNLKALEQLRDYIKNNPKFSKIKTYYLPDLDKVDLYSLNKSLKER